MNLVFWGEEHQCGTSAHMLAVVAMLRVLGEPTELRVGHFVSRDSAVLGVCDCKTGFSGKKRHFLWHSDLVVVCLKQQKSCIDAFFQNDFHMAKNMMFLLGGFECEEEADARYLKRVYRVAPEQVAVIPYNNKFFRALVQGRSEAFIRKELKTPTSGAEEQFVHSVESAAVRIMHRLRYDF